MNTIAGTVVSKRIRKQVVIATVAIPVLYAMLVCAHWTMERYFRFQYHDIYGVCQPIIFFMTCGVLFASPFVAAIVVLKHRHFERWFQVALYVVVALSPILFVYIRARA